MAGKTHFYYRSTLKSLCHRVAKYPKINVTHTADYKWRFYLLMLSRNTIANINCSWNSEKTTILILFLKPKFIKYLSNFASLLLKRTSQILSNYKGWISRKIFFLQRLFRMLYTFALDNWHYLREVCKCLFMEVAKKVYFSQ